MSGTELRSIRCATQGEIETRGRRQAGSARPACRPIDTKTAGQGKRRPGDRASPLSDHAAGFDPHRHPYTYNPERARELLRAAGHANGFKTALAYNTADPMGEPVSAQLRSAFDDVGVTLELQALPSPVYTDALFTVKRPMSFYEAEPIHRPPPTRWAPSTSPRAPTTGWDTRALSP